MKHWKRQATALGLAGLLVFSSSVPTYAWSIGGAIESIGGTIGDTLGDIADVAEDLVGDVVDVAVDVGGEIGDFAGDAVDGIEDIGGAALDELEDLGGDALGELEDLGGDALDVLDDISDEALDGLEFIGEGALDGLEIIGEGAISVAVGAYKLAESAVNLIADFNIDFSSLEHDPLKGLPVLVVSTNSATEMFTNAGEITVTDNVQTKRLKSSSYSKIKGALEDEGVPGLVVDFVLDRAGGIDGDDIGGKIVEYMPMSTLYGGVVSSAINDLLNAEDFEDINLFTDDIRPQNDVAGFTFEYKIPKSQLTPIGDNAQLVISGMNIGGRDDVKVEVVQEMATGMKKSTIAEARAVNGLELGYEALLYEVGSTENVYIRVINDFEKPLDAPREIAKTIQSGINSAIPGRSPISNGAANTIESLLDDVGLEEMTASGDVGTILADKLLGSIPLLGDLLDLAGVTDELAGGIRMLVGQVEVRSYANLNDFHVRAFGYGSSAAMASSVAEATEEASVGAGHEYYDHYVFEEDILKFSEEGGRWKTEGEMIYKDSGRGNIFLDGKTYSNFVAELDMSIAKEGNAGLIYRVSDIEGTDNAFNGYQAGIGFNNGQGFAFIGRISNGWTDLDVENMNIDPNKTYTLRLVATGPKMELYVDDSLCAQAMDGAFSSGYMGLQAKDTTAEFETLAIAEYLPEDTARYDFAYSVPQMDDLTDNWELDLSDYSTKLRATPKQKSNEYTLIENQVYENMVLKTQVMPSDDLGQAGVLFRVSDYENGTPNDGYYLSLSAGKDGQGQINLYKLSEGGRKDLLASEDSKVLEDQQNDVSLRVVDNRIIAIVNDDGCIGAYDDTYTSGYVGFAAEEKRASFDDVNIIDMGMHSGAVLAGNTNPEKKTIKLNITTGNVTNGVTGNTIRAKVYYKDGARNTVDLTALGGRFDVSGETTVSIELLPFMTFDDVSKIALENMGGDGWFLTYVNGQNPNGSQIFKGYHGNFLDIDTKTPTAVIYNSKHKGDVNPTQFNIEIEVDTVENAGTDDDVYARVYFKDHTHVPYRLDYVDANDFEQGTKRSYKIVLPNGKTLSDIAKVDVEKPGTDGLKIKQVAMLDTNGVVMEWLGIETWLDSDDKITSVTAYRAEPQNWLYDLTLNVATGTDKNSDTDDDIYVVVVYNDKSMDHKMLDYDNYNDFEKGDVKNYSVELRPGKTYDDVGSVLLFNAGDDGWCMKSVTGLAPDGSVLFSKTGPVWIDQDDTKYLEVSN